MPKWREKFQDRNSILENPNSNSVVSTKIPNSNSEASGKIAKLGNLEPKVKNPDARDSYVPKRRETNLCVKLYSEDNSNSQLRHPET